MKFQTLIIGVVLIASSCTPPQFTQSNLQGGVDGGGGNTFIAQPVTSEEIESVIVSDAKVALSGFFIGNEKLLASTKPEYQKLYPKIFTLLDTVAIEIRSNQLCSDHEGNHKDGSIYAQSENAICISTYSMAGKLNQQNYEAETFGLIAHELSHLAGFNEVEAIQLQNDVVNTYAKESFKNKQEMLAKANKFLEQIISTMQFSIKDKTWDGYNAPNSFVNVIDDFRKKVKDSSNINFITSTENDLILVEYLRLYNLSEFVYASDTLLYSEGQRNYGKDCLEHTFQGRGSVTAYEAFKTPNTFNLHLDKEVLSNIVFLNPRNLDIAKSEMSVTSNFLSDLLVKFNERSSAQFVIIK
ncbi:MAG: hypothetical protein Q7U04_09515 [Bacteriovorax sp.]|nr:hypothetical protein [Bacteriovorax sp.]